MENLLWILGFFIGLILVFGIGYLIGHILKIDKFLRDKP